MTQTLRSALSVGVETATYHNDPNPEASASQKARDYLPLTGYTVRNAAELLDGTIGFGPESNEVAHLLASTGRWGGPGDQDEPLGFEGDTVRIRNRYCTPVGTACNIQGIQERSEAGPPGSLPPNTPWTTVTVDVNYVLATGNRALAVIECKRPYTIDEAAWKDPANNSQNKKRISKQLRMYFYAYRCRWGLVFDGCVFILVHLNATNREQLKSQTCPTSVYFLSFIGVPPTAIPNVAESRHNPRMSANYCLLRAILHSKSVAAAL